MPLPVVLSTNEVPDDVMEPVQGLATVLQGPGGGLTMPRAEVLDLAPQLSAIVNQGELDVDEELLDSAPLLRVIANVAAGFNNMDPDLLNARGVWGCNTPDAFYESTADFTMAMILAAVRMLALGDRYIRADRWKRFEPGVWDGVLLRDKVLGIVGYGRTGKAVAQRARAFGMRILYTRRSVQDDPEYRTLEALLVEADIVSLHTPLTEETQHLIDAERLQAMKRGAWLINMARGPVVDEEALVQALQSGHLAGAALDVFEEEPIVHPALLSMDNVVLAPHVGGGTQEARYMSRRQCFENVALVLRGERPLTPVNELS
ncbi:MAG: D-glycerate dehydrogenase [Anaerolineae bacterium]|nr:D-glycerate dehydrogenase [Anaerolineae bacterium]